MKLNAYGLSDIGRKRENNQDSYLLNDKAKLYVVADGMGGHVGGEVASKLAVDTLNRVFSYTSRSFEPSSYLVKAIQEANNMIYERAVQTPSLKGMGTTMTCLLFSYDTVFIAHVGDSRAYFVREGMIWQLSQDHSLVSEQMVAGGATAMRNIITRSVGYDRHVDVDLYTKKVAAGDIYLLCSDGLYGFVSHKEMAQVVSSSPLNAAAKKLIDLANQRGGDDNITSILVKVEEV
ncbi:MAG: Stp1/IreP family PP2C-type Ser/Thr phosphatase [Deltaproteobacteria bacterium]|nr:Stp1/IreP family PP2C-type Ser/Thr phosphatase [Deltaproteobacteria bacterium]